MERLLNSITRRSLISVVAVSSVLSGCLGDSNVKRNTASSSSAAETTAATQESNQSQPGATIRFDYGSFYSLNSPHPETGCAGDARTYYNYNSLSSTGALSKFDASSLLPSMTYKPSFIKNVSVDLTDANADVDSNAAYSCSYGASAAATRSSSCATFDYGAIGGVPTSLGGSLFIMGGVQTWNYAGIATSVPLTGKGHSLNCGAIDSAGSYITSCSANIFALGIETLPASAAGSDLAPGAATTTTTAISSWANLNPSGLGSATVPNGAAGSSIAYDPDTQKIVLFGGASPFTNENTAQGSDTVDTWTYDVKTQAWAKVNPVPYASAAITNLYDTDSGTPQNHSKTISGRALFGYAAVPNLSLTKMNTTGIPTGSIDATERIVTVGGATGTSVSKRTYRFNPTFGPEWIDGSDWANSSNTPAAATVPAAGSVTQWLDSYHTQLLSNSDATSQFSPSYNAATLKQAMNFGLVPALVTVVGNITGYFVGLGGFDYATALNTDRLDQGGMWYSDRSDTSASQVGNFIAQPNLLTGANMTPLLWREIADNGAEVTRWLGAASTITGFNKALNEIMNVGGTDCRDFMTDGTLTCNFDNPGYYYRLGAAFPANLAGITVAMAGTTPKRAGMASARGYDGAVARNTIIIALGGMSAVAQTTDAGNDDKIHVAWNNGGTPTWIAAVTPTGTLPPRLTNASMVFSHVTGKFYLFGGYRTGAVIETLADTYELTVTGDCTLSTCTFAWKKLDASTGLTCFPDCPTKRRSHRMVEVNYNNTSPTADVVPTTCTATAPCSFGIFMEGGSPDGFGALSDRWMFDPTANAGNGHWQRVDGFPPRHLAALTTVDYTMPDGTGKARRAILFGGETGLSTPERGLATHVPPTLGDTFMYDFDNNSWQRVQLLGKGYLAPLPTSTEYEIRQSYESLGAPANQEELAALSPPALSGAVMVTRTMSASGGNSGTPLPIPEVFLFGGRLKNGMYSTLDNVYKFCVGTTGEKPSSVSLVTDDAACDSFDNTTNPNSTSPTRAYIGRWLKKNAISLSGVAGDGSRVASYLGAGAYDSVNDRIVLWGGLTEDDGTPGNNAVTDSPVAATFTTTGLVGAVYEYTPPARAGLAQVTTPQGVAETNLNLRNGRWDPIGNCSNSPTAPTERYGHTMGYDPLGRQIVVVGGMDPTTGAQLVQSQTDSNGSSYTTPEVWTAKKVTSLTNLPNGVPTAPAAVPCYYWTQKTTFGNAYDIAAQRPPTTGLSHAAAVFIPGTGYNTGYYAMQDQYCTNAGPIASNDPGTSKLYAGGAYIDLDRKKLGPNENALLHLTYIPMGTSNQRPDGKNFTESEVAVMKVHLIRSGLNETQIQSTFQPRHLQFTDDDQYPRTVHTLQVLAPPTGGVRQDQLILPLGIDPKIDRIRIERVSGSAILIDATIVRMGYR